MSIDTVSPVEVQGIRHPSMSKELLGIENPAPDGCGEGCRRAEDAETECGVHDRLARTTDPQRDATDGGALLIYLRLTEGQPLAALDSLEEAVVSVEAFRHIQTRPTHRQPRKARRS